MNLLQLFKASLHSPKKIAAFRLIPIGKVMQYIFIYILLITSISFVQFINGISIQQANMEGLLEYFQEIQWLLYPFSFIFLFVLNTLLIFVRISIFAYVGVIILSLLKRKGEYRHLWRSTLFASTIPMLISVVVAFFNISTGYIQFFIYFVTLVYLFLACKYYPIKR
ncbi:4-hydroxy-3-methylbut-2-en-1-yl diphosphate synthase [Bacillus sp. FJAT-22090]|uniref:DUF1189 family protein n=1 Tax=Bacillus sp. FJAT-22090 TaxID=1581038 RepID=UPI0006B04682|nr:DUF1189 family protein [Bacillus sp. FJAT-22090]ALC84958.1 4-hydroxy-3-methylbut-2-en-1-yl diphosphate synthase [Bacillus sp. FJAT-22090]